MSEHHRGAWGSREEAVWWPGAITTQDQQTLHHQHLINQHHQQQQQQQLVQQQQAQQIQQHQVVQQAQGQQHNDIQRSNNSTVPGQQLFSYKMASSFQNPAGQGVTVATTNAGAYDYRLNMTPAAAANAAPGTQWWYSAGQNIDQIHQNQQHQQTNQHQQTVHGVTHTPPPTVCIHFKRTQLPTLNRKNERESKNPNVKLFKFNSKLPIIAALPKKTGDLGH